MSGRKWQEVWAEMLNENLKKKKKKDGNDCWKLVLENK